jgi:hypothetical protein
MLRPGNAGDPRESASVAELTGVLPVGMFADYSPGMRHHRAPGTTPPRRPTRPDRRTRRMALYLFATDTQIGQQAWLDARHRSHARVEDSQPVRKL